MSTSKPVGSGTAVIPITAGWPPQNYDSFQAPSPWTHWEDIMPKLILTVTNYPSYSDSSVILAGCGHAEDFSAFNLI
jgi:hypothetical protein